MMEDQLPGGYSPSELITAKFNELRGNALSKYFFLYFLHLLGHLSYKEENGEAVFSDPENTFRAPMPVIDSDAKYKEMERLHRNLEKFFEFLKKQSPPEEGFTLNLLENI